MADQWLMEQIIAIRSDLATIKECIRASTEDINDHETRIGNLEACVPEARNGGWKSNLKTGGISAGAAGGIVALVELLKFIITGGF